MGDVVDLRTTGGAVAIERDGIRVHGPAAVSYLQGQLSQDVQALGIGESARTLLLEPTGKVTAWLRVTRQGEDDVLLDVDAGHGEAVRARLQRFKLRVEAELEPVSLRGWALRGAGFEQREAVGPEALALPAEWPGVAGVDLFGDDLRLPMTVAELPTAALEALRIEAGVPAMGADLTEATIPAEAGQWLIDLSVDFAKGCYTGQELVARIDSRGGNVPRPLRGLLVDGDAVPTSTTVALGGKEVGAVTSSATSAVLGAVALAPVARSVAPGETVELCRPDGSTTSARVATLPLR